MAEHAAKVVILGEGAVGKTSLVRRYVDKAFDENYVATVGVNTKNKVIDDLDIEMNLWDIYGQKSISPGKHSTHYIGSEGAVVVYDVVRRRTFDTLDRWIYELFQVTGKIPVVVLGNKVDIIEDYEEAYETVFTSASLEEFHDYMVEEYYDRSIYTPGTRFVPVPFSELKGWARRDNDFGIKFPYLLTSAKTGKNVEKAFRYLAKRMIKNKIRYV